MDRAVFYIACVVLLLPSVTIGVEELKPELITTENNDYVGYLDEFEGFQCQAKGTNLKYSWKHNDITIDPTYILKFPTTNNSILKPLPVNLDLSYQGKYQCFVRNSIGTIFGRLALVKFTVVGDFLDRVTKETIGVVTGRTFFIHCPRHRPSQNVQYNWYYKEADSYLPLPSSSNYFVSDNGTLYFSVLKKEDYDFINEKDGIVCHQQATVKGSKMRAVQSHLIELTETGNTAFVNATPEIKAPPNDRTIFTGSPPIVLKCGAIGYPIPTITWYRVNAVSDAETEVKTGPDFKLLRDNQYLSIKNVGPDKAGKYKCVAKNVVGETEAIALVKVADRPTWKTGGELQDVQATLYSKLVWTCSAFGGTTYDWFRNGVAISKTSSGDANLVIETKDSESDLIIKNVTAAYNGMYQCTASNDLDIIYSTARLQVKETKPKFTERMAPITLIRSRTGLIPCPVVASPAPEITWKKDGVDILKDRKALVDKRFSLHSNGLGLLISNVTDTDKGVYTCRAKNRLDVAVDSSVVSVGADITWISAPVDNRNVTITLRYYLECEAEGDPSYEVNYRWLRNGLPLEYTARIHWVKDQHRLVILDAIVSDTGMYTCIASAETPLYIEKRKDVDIVVKAPADPPDIVWLIGSCWSEDASLTWKVGALNNEEVYEYWIDWASNYNPSNWIRLPKVLEEDPKPVKLDFKLLPPFSQVSFRVSIFNRIGAGEPSIPTDPSDCITKPAAPRFSPAEILGVPGGPNTLKLEWTPVEQTFWGGPGFNYSVEWRRVTTGNEEDEKRWEDVPEHQKTRILYGSNHSLSIKNPGYYVEWEFRIRSNNFLGSAPSWTYNKSYSGQDAPKGRPRGLTTDRISAREADISWQRLQDPDKGNIEGYKIRYWHSPIGMDVAYKKDPNTRAKRDLEAQSEGHARERRDLAGVPRSRQRREDEEEDEEGEEPLDFCFNPDEPCEQIAPEKESQLKELSPYKEYHVRIAAFNSGGLGPWSNEFMFETSEAAPGPPYAVNTYAYDKYCKLTWKEPRHKNGIILEYEIYGKQIIRTRVPWWMKRHIIYELTNGTKYEAKIRARTSSGWGSPVFRWFQTHDELSKPAKPLVPEVVGYGEDGVNVTFMEPLPKTLRKFGGELDEDPWEYRPVGGYEMENLGVGGYPERFYVVYRKKYSKDQPKRTTMKQMWGPLDQTWIVIENLEKDTVYKFATVPVNSLGEGPRSDWAMGLTGGIVPKVEKLHWYQRDWFIALIILFFAALLLLLIIVLSTIHLKDIYYEGAPKRRKDRERERIYEPEDVDGGFNEFTLKSARSSRSVVTSRSEAPPPYNSVIGSSSRHSGDFDEDEDVTDSDDEKHEVSTYYSDEKKVPLDDLDDDDEEDSRLATFV